MSAGKVVAIVVALAAFGAGIYIGQSGEGPAPVITGSDGASFSGGYNAADDADAAASGSAQPVVKGAVHVVKNGESIQAAVTAAQPGDTIQVMPGTYVETVYIDKDNIHMLGVIEKGKWPTLEGETRLNDAILYSGNGIIIENFKITHYKGNGIMGQAGNNFIIRNNLIVDTGVYGIFPQLGKNGVVEHNVISGIEDAAIYVGMSDNIHVAHNEVFDSVAGIEIENSRHAIVENNYTHNNTGGILAFITPGLPIKTTYDVIIRNNFVVNNNTENFGAPGSTVAGIPAGTGILVMAADKVIIENNIISNNKTAGILVTDHYSASNVTIDPESEPNADEISILNNIMLNNGWDTIDEIKALMLTELKQGNPDIIRVGKSRDSCIINRHQYITVGVDDFAECAFTNTDDVKDYLLAEPVPPRQIVKSEQGKLTYMGICTGCHTYTGRMIGPPVQVIQALYMDNPQGLADYIAKPVKKREDYPEMPPQNYLDEEARLAVAKYMLQLTK
ncbi:parallel beta-helix domain-containing protein [Oceanicoccus sp. KOV_DT_Chl]|uniref:parallel beta-helix domain-containing protein n=1 Tax=Oceanicoccus sp. KOV_DT_Chl TaxID=1904639 RepID=UPI000C7E579E|nr:parallel beta-helix domain-containing protein [Oceanicoccus sp. KOV_DT_Chl]